MGNTSLYNATNIQLINDAIHGPIKLTPLIYQMINTKEFHRLKYLRQQGQFKVTTVVLNLHFTVLNILLLLIFTP